MQAALHGVSLARTLCAETPHDPTNFEFLALGLGQAACLALHADEHSAAQGFYQEARDLLDRLIVLYPDFTAFGLALQNLDKQYSERLAAALAVD